MEVYSKCTKAASVMSTGRNARSTTSIATPWVCVTHHTCIIIIVFGHHLDRATSAVSRHPVRAYPNTIRIPMPTESRALSTSSCSCYCPHAHYSSSLRSLAPAVVRRSCVFVFAPKYTSHNSEARRQDRSDRCVHQRERGGARLDLSCFVFRFFLCNRH